MNNYNRIVILAVASFFILLQSGYCQLITAPLGSCGPLQQNPIPHHTSRSNPDTLSLPFLEDFSYDGPRPDPSKWIDGGVFINADFPINPPSWGVATFDGLNAAGLPYSNIAEHGSADTLTSLPIALNLAPSDSIYLSFQVQPKGRGNFPEYIDTLQLEFKTPKDTAWRWAWSMKGEDFPQKDRPFVKVMIPITDTSLLKKGFQFRFRNYAQLNGGWDHWHIDYIRLDKGRYKTDTLVMDYAFMYKGRSLLKTYQSIPLRHFLVTPVSHMSETFSMSLVNNTASASNRYYGYSFWNQFGEEVDFLSNKNKGPIPPHQEFIMTEPTKYTYENPGPGYEYATFLLKHELNDNAGDIIPRNDTTSYFQILSNYYALDDGTAEERIGMENAQGGFVAQRFETLINDTLKAMQYFFNEVNDGIIDRPFYISVWAEGVNKPGKLLYSQGPVQPVSKGWNKYTNYPLDKPLYLQAGTYYFGWSQETGTSMNLGFDRNINSNDRIYYNQTGDWFNYTAEQGTLMIRPMFYKPEDTYVSVYEPINKDKDFLIFPNPTTSSFQIRTDEQGPLSLEIIDYTGRQVLTRKEYNPDSLIDIQYLESGIYLVRLNGNNNRMHRLVVIKP